MKRDILKKTLIGLMLMAPFAVVAQGNDANPTTAEKAKKEEEATKILNDSTVRFTYKDGMLSLDNPTAGDLYKYAENKKPYKFIYYLFTSMPYLHLSDSSIAENDDFMMVNDGKGMVMNVLTQDRSKSTAKFKMTDESPYRCIVWDKKEAQVQLSIDAQGNPKKEAILLVVRPKLDTHSLDCRLQYGEEKITFDEFKNKTLDPEVKDVFSGYTLVVTRSNSIVVDSITCVKPNSKLRVNNEDNYHDTPLREGLFEIPLDNIEVNEKSKEVKFCIHYRTFEKDGKIMPRYVFPTLVLNWEKTGNVGALIIVGVVLLLATALFFIFKKNKLKKNKNNGERTQTDEPTQQGGKVNKIETGKKTVEEGEDQEVDGNSQGKTVEEGENQGVDGNPQGKTVEEGEKQEASHPTNDKRFEHLNNTPIRKIIIKLIKLKNDNKKLKKDNNKLKNDISELKKKNGDANQDKSIIEDLRRQIRNLKEEKNNAKERADEVAEKLTEETRKHKSEIERLNNDITDAKQSAQSAWQQVEGVEASKKEAIAEAKADVARERNEELEKLTKLADKLKELLDGIPNDACGGVGATLKLGIKKYRGKLAEEIQQNLSLKCSLDKIREYSLSQLGLDSSCWMHSLGRIYSYMSVETLRNQLEYEGIDIDTLADAFLTLTALLAAQGIVVVICSPGFDSNNDPRTRKMFELDMQIDRITSWLEGIENVRNAIPNHGSTIYDFGTLAYYTSEDTEIHQGKVIYYDK